MNRNVLLQNNSLKGNKLMNSQISPDALKNALMNDEFLEGKSYTMTKIGIITKCNLNTYAPPAWRKLTRKQGIQVKEQLIQILNDSSIVAFADGKIDGLAYGANIHESYGKQCEEVFLIKQYKQFNSPQSNSHHQNQQFGLGSTHKTVQSNMNYGLKQLYQQKSFGQPYLAQNAPPEYQDTPKITFQEQFLKTNKNMKTSLGLVAKCALKAEIPAGWRKLTRQQGQQIKHQLNKFLDDWSIVAFQNGKIDGKGYGNKIHCTYGNQCGQIFVISQTF